MSTMIEGAVPCSVEGKDDDVTVTASAAAAAATAVTAAGTRETGTTVAIAPVTDPRPPSDLIVVSEPASADVLCGRGAAVNAHTGNKRFRALCFSRKPLFDAGNHAAKKRVAMEVVRIAMNDWGTRFLKKDKEKGPWYVMTEEQAILKSSQIMRDYNRPDRVAQRESQPAGKIKRYRDSATPMDDVVFAQVPPEPLVENPFGVHDHDVLCGRGAYVNGNAGNQRLRELALQRKAQFDRGNFTEKRVLATEIVTIIRSLDPPGRFLQRARGAGDGKSTSTWEELSDERAIHKACQVMRDIDRQDRKHRVVRKQQREALRRMRRVGEGGEGPPGMISQAASLLDGSLQLANPSAILEGIVDSADVVKEAVAAAAEEIMDKALEETGVPSQAGGETGFGAPVGHEDLTPPTAIR